MFFSYEKQDTICDYKIKMPLCLVSTYSEEFILCVEKIKLLK